MTENELTILAAILGLLVVALLFAFDEWRRERHRKRNR